MNLKNGNFSMDYGDKVKLITKIEEDDTIQRCSILKNLLRRVLKTSK
jgi:hypothetical protein